MCPTMSVSSTGGSVYCCLPPCAFIDRSTSNYAHLLCVHDRDALDYYNWFPHVRSNRRKDNTQRVCVCVCVWSIYVRNRKECSCAKKAKNSFKNENDSKNEMTFYLIYNGPSRPAFLSVFGVPKWVKNKDNHLTIPLQ